MDVDLVTRKNRLDAQFQILQNEYKQQQVYNTQLQREYIQVNELYKQRVPFFKTTQEVSALRVRNQTLNAAIERLDVYFKRIRENIRAYDA